MDAGVQGRFWKMNDALFSIQETVKTEAVDPVELAVRLGLNRSDFKRCLESRATAERIASCPVLAQFGTSDHAPVMAALEG